MTSRLLARESGGPGRRHSRVGARSSACYRFRLKASSLEHRVGAEAIALSTALLAVAVPTIAALLNPQVDTTSAERPTPSRE